jgi:hypothetical protein
MPSVTAPIDHPLDQHHPAWPALCAIVGPLLPVPQSLEPGTLLADLRLDDLDRDVIAMELGDCMGLNIPDEAARRWLTLADVLASVQPGSRQPDSMRNGGQG